MEKEFERKMRMFLFNVLNIKDAETNYKEYIQKQNEYYSTKYNPPEELGSVEHKIRHIKIRLNEIVQARHIDNYIATDFISKLAELKELEKAQIKLSQIKEENDIIRSTYGDLSNKKQNKDKKSVEEIKLERNLRLAAISKIKGQMDEAEYLKTVSAVRNTYDRMLKSAVLDEANAQPTIKMGAQKFKEVLKKALSIFKIGKHKNRVSTNDNRAQREVFGMSACDAIRDEYLSAKTEKEKTDCFAELCQTGAEIPQINISLNAQEIIDKYFEQQADKIKHINAHDQNKLDSSLEQLRKRYFGFTRATDTSRIKKGVWRESTQLDDDKLDIENFMLKNYAHKMQSKNTAKGMEVTTVFEDQKIQTAYEELQKMFEKLKQNISENVKAEQQLNDYSKQVLETLNSQKQTSK